MKKNITLSFLVLSLVIFCSCNSTKRIRGDKNIIQKEISISEYNKIEVKQFADIFYTQNDSTPPYLIVEIDSNLVEHLNLIVKDQSLMIEAKKTISLVPSKFVIHTNSKDLEAVSIAGMGNIKGVGKLKTEKFTASIAGSGNITFDSLEVNSTTAKIAGAGDIKFGGTAIKSSYSIAGSGNIYTKNLIQDTVRCKIAGSGDIEVNAKDELKNSIAGSGDIKYVGNPKVNNSIAGSGNIRQID